MNSNEWVIDTSNILSQEMMTRIKSAIERDYIIVEHMHYAGGSSKDTLLFYDFDMFEEHIQGKAKPGDLFYIYSLDDLYQKELYLVRAKYPDEQGRTPTNGPY